MKKKSLLIALSLALTLGFTSTAKAAQLFDNVFYFGDSLTDIGNASFAGSLINPGGLRWAQYLSADFGLGLAPSKVGGNDFAYADAQTSFPPFPPANAREAEAAPHNVQAQILELLNRGVPLDKKALYAVWAGSNNVAQQLPRYVARFIQEYILTFMTLPTTAQIANFIQTIAAPQIINQGVNDLVGIAQQLYASGARFILIANLPDLGRTPGTIASPFASALSQITTSFNQTLSSRLGALNIDVIQLDIQSLFTYVANNPQQFGFINSTSQANQNPGINPNLFLFWNSEHPTGAAQQIVGDYAYSVLTGPLSAAILAEAPFSVMQGQNFSIENQIYAARTGMLCIPTCGSAAFFNANYIPVNVDQDQTSNPEINFHPTNFTAGLLHRFNENFLLGFAVGRSDGSVDFSDNIDSVSQTYTRYSGGFNLNENMLSILGNYQCHKLYIDGMVDGGLINFNDIKRVFPLGIFTNVTRATTHGQQADANLIAGYNFANCRLKTGPIANVDYQILNVNAFAETDGLPGTNLQYLTQNNQSLVSGIGWQGSYNFCLNNIALMPFAQVTYNYQWLDGERDIRAGLVSLPASHYHIPFPGMNENFALANAGLIINPTPCVSISLNYQSTIFQSDARLQNIMAGVQVLLN